MPRGNDDLDLEGNWSTGGGDDDGEPAPAAGGGGAGKKGKKGAKRKRQSSAGAAAAEGAKGGAAEAAADATVAGKSKKKRKKGGAILAAVVNSEQVPKAGVGADELRHWALTRLATAWVAEAKASKLTPLETKEVRPLPSWFVSVPPDVALTQLPKQLKLKGGKVDAAFPGRSVLQAVCDEKPLPKATPRGISVLVLCSSTDRVFAVKAELEQSWKCKPLALAAHGGGRKRDQVARQAKAIASGVSVAVATPARLFRLMCEDHVDPKCLALIIFDLARDRKQRDVLTLQETRGDFFKVLRQHLAPLLPSKAPSSEEGLALLLCGSRAE